MSELTVGQGLPLSLRPHLNKRERRFLRAWGVSCLGKPIASLPETAAALWYGNRFNSDDETISFILTSTPDTPRPALLYANCYFGVATRSMIELATDPLEVFANAAYNPCQSQSGYYNVKFLIAVLGSYVKPPK